MNPALVNRLMVKLPLLKRPLHLPVLPLLAAGLLLSALLAAASGAVSIPFGALITGALDAQQGAVLFSIRLPRVLLGALVGAALAVSGAAMQGLFRNPLADPGLIGIASGAALAVAIVIVVAGPLVGLLGIYSLAVAAFGGGFVTCVLIFRLARLTGRTSVTYILLAGIAVSALTGAATGFLTYISNDQQLRALTFWTMGSLGGALWPATIVCATLVLPCVTYFIMNARRVNILLLGEDEAKHLGVDCEALKRGIIICTALCVGAAVAVSGIIGFVGLVVPHLVRLTLGPDHRLLFPASALLGAMLLVLADTAARTVVIPAELPVGILTSLIGGPFFLWLLIKQYAGRFGM